MPEIANRTDFDVSTLPTEKVTVFSDRAEVCRRLKIQLNTGLNEICVEKLPDTVDSQSIRVEGYGDAAVITEVKYQEKKAMREEVATDKQKAIQDQLSILNRKKKSVEQRSQRLSTQKSVLENLAQNFISTNSQEENKDDKEGCRNNLLVENANLAEHLEKFLNFYGGKVNDLDDSFNDMEKQVEQINEEIRVLNSQAYDQRIHQSGTMRCLTIFLNAVKSVVVELDVFYMVSRASWNPSYVIRVQADDKLMKIIYYGMIRQKTGEDWKNAKITLSTAMPMVGGQVPQLGTTKVSFYKPPKPVICARTMADSTMMRSRKMKICTESGVLMAAAPPPMACSYATFKENATSAAFEIENATSIPSDDSSHKVTIAMVDLQPKFQFEAVPSKSPCAFFKATALNSSKWPFLAGPTSIFVNDNFVANGRVPKSVNGGETFDVSLGADPSIKVEYRAAKKFNEEWGLLNKSAAITREQKIGLHNTKNEAVRVTVLEPFPQSTDEKIKVTLLEPNLHKNEKASSVARLNKLNNVEWLIFVPPGEKRELLLKYQIEYPKGEHLDYNTED